MELRALKLMALHARALSRGVAAPVAEEAMEAGDPKEALLDLIVEVESRRGSTEDCALSAKIVAEVNAQATPPQLDFQG